MSEMPDVATLTTISSDWGNDIRDRTIQRYSSVANRTSEHASPAEGDLSYLEDSNTVWVYNGTAWVQLVPGPVATANIADVAVTTAKVADGAVTAAKLTLGWITTDPEFAGISPGTGFVEALKHIQIGKTVICRGHIVLGTGGDVTGTITLTLPVTAATAELNTPIGLCKTAGAQFASGVVELTSTTACKFLVLTEDGGGYVRPVTIAATIPFDWGVGNALYFQFTYEAA